MPVSVLMPALSPTMTSGTLSRWLVKEGDAVHSGDVMAEIETDKATMEVEAVDEGIVGKILVPEKSADVMVNTPIAVILEDGESASALEGFDTGGAVVVSPPASLAAAPPASLAAAPPASPAAAPPASPPASLAAAPPASPAALTPDSADTRKPAQEPAPASKTPFPPGQSGGRVFASPLARRIAASKGINLTQVTGSGPHGRIILRDVENLAPTAATSTTSIAGVEASDDPAFERVPLSTMRRVIAERLSYAKQTIPHFYLSCDCRIDALLDLRTQMNAGAEKADKISVNDIIVKASAMALINRPRANACFDGDGENAAIKYFEHADIAVAVSIDEGLITPLVRRANALTLGQISRKIKDLASRARQGKLAPEEYRGGSFTVSNLGMFGVDQFQAVINPPHACILAVGRGRQQPVISASGAIEAATVMNITLSVDHRAVDGAVGAELLSELKLLLENPVKMLL